MKKILYLLAVVFVLGCDKESSDTNVEVKSPDLIGLKLNVTSLTSTSINYDYTLKNIGEGRANMDGATVAKNLSVQGFLSVDAIYDKSDIGAGGSVVGVSPLGYLEPDEELSGKMICGFNVSLTKYKYLILIVDWGNTVAESNEENNILTCLIK